MFDGLLKENNQYYWKFLLRQPITNCDYKVKKKTIQGQIRTIIVPFGL